MPYISTVKTLGEKSIETTISFDNDATLAEFLYLILDNPTSEIKEQTPPLDVVLDAIHEYTERHNRRPASMQFGPMLQKQVTKRLQVLPLEGMMLFGVAITQKSFAPDLYIEIED